MSDSPIQETDCGRLAACGSEHVGKRVLVALLSDYYLFDYYRDLVPRLAADGFDVTVLTNDRRVPEKFKAIEPRANVVSGPPWIRWASNRAGRLMPRMMLWIFAWAWSAILRRRFDFAIVPWDYGVILHVLSRSLPALTVHNTTDFLDIELKLNRIYLPTADAEKSGHKFWLFVDRLLEGRLLPKANGRILRYDSKWLLDRVMGCRRVNGQHGFSGIRYLTVMGEEIKANYHRLGVGVAPNPTEVIVTGSPNFESLMDLPTRFGEAHRRELRASLGMPVDAFAFSFFLSPSSFSDEQIAEVADVVATLGSVRTDAWFILKFHPKTRAGDPQRVLSSLGKHGERATIVTEFGGDEWNAGLVLASDCLVQKQSTVGYLAMMFSVPILSYNLRPTDYDDDMYRIIGGSYHAETRAELIANLERLSSDDGRRRLAEAQAEACRRYCRTDCSPCGEISAIIQRHFNTECMSAHGDGDR